MMIGDPLTAMDDDGDDTGQLMTMAMLDHETKASYMVMVTATDAAGLTGSIMVTISVNSRSHGLNHSHD
jgi:hypothetical protein